MKYKHTQTGYLMIIALVAIVLLFAIIVAQTGFDAVMTAIMAAVIFIVFSFRSLTVMIDDEYLSIKFGYGIFRKKFAIREIASAEAVRNHWYYGWGIRWWWPNTWVFNVSGLDAVEIRMHDNKIYRIGTDEPKRLESAIRHAIRL